jgi:SAM-dependent methyltransferase
LEPRETTERTEGVAGNLEKRRSERLRWDRVAERMPDLSPATSTGYYRRCEVALLRRALDSFAGKRVLKLDLWNEAFNTRILHWIEGQGAEAFGLDVSGVIAARAARNAGAAGRRLHLLQADIRRIPFPGETFDFVYTMGTIEHIEEYRDTLREIRRVLKPGGRAVIGVPHRWNVFLRPLLVAFLEALGKYPYCPEKSFGYGELKRDVEESGLTVLAREGLLLLPGVLRLLDLYLNLNGNPLGRLVPPLLFPFEYLETNRPALRRFGYLTAVLAEKPSGPAVKG